MSEIEKTVGQGGMGKCKVFYSEKYGKKVLAKRIIPNMCMRGSILPQDPILGLLQLFQVANNQKQMEKLLKKEAAFMGLLKLTKMDCCVEILDFIKEPPSIIMEYCEGGDLRKILDDRELTNYDKLIFIDQILQGIEKIHNFGIIHGDLKCSNLFLKNNYKKDENKENQVKIGDFGLSQIKGELVKGGTPGFIAPEIQEGKGGSFESDIYSLGKVMLEILTCWDMRKVQMINENNFNINHKYFPKFLGDTDFYLCVKKCLSSCPENRPKIKDLIQIFKLNVLVNFITYELKKMKRIAENNQVLENYKIGDKGVIEKHNHLLILANDNIRGYHNGWSCDICGNDFNTNSPSWFCKKCGYNVCFDCYKKFKKNVFFVKKDKPDQKPNLTERDEIERNDENNSNNENNSSEASSPRIMINRNQNFKMKNGQNFNKTNNFRVIRLIPIKNVIPQPRICPIIPIFRQPQPRIRERIVINAINVHRTQGKKIFIQRRIFLGGH